MLADRKSANPSSEALVATESQPEDVAPPSDSIPNSHPQAEASPLPAFNAPPVSPLASETSLPALGELKEKILAALRKDRHSLAAAMDKAENWDIRDETLTLRFSSPFESSFIEKEAREIERIIVSELGWKLNIKTEIRRKESINAETPVDEQVELVRNVFRGTVI